MKKYILFLFTAFVAMSFVKDNSQSYKDGEYLQYRIHYGVLNAGFASLTVNKTHYEGKSHFHIVGEGSSSGAVRTFYKIDDRYETFIDESSNKPSKFVRKISEGGYTRDQVFYFNHQNKTVKIDDKKAQKISYKEFSSHNIQDLISAFYYLRNYDTDNLKTGDFINVDIFMSDETYKFKLKILGRENIKTKYGTIKSLKIRPYVQSGRIFKESESVTMWVTDDQNHIPLLIKAELTVGSLKATLNDYKNAKYPLSFK
jgi:hypothetical protein